MLLSLFSRTIIFEKENFNSLSRIAPHLGHSGILFFVVTVVIDIFSVLKLTT